MTTIEEYKTLTEEQQITLNKFRSSLADSVENKEDDYYLPWLIAREFDLQKAEKMFRDNLQWRLDWKMDSILEWQAPEVLERYHPFGILGHDKQGNPAYAVPFGGIDIWGLVRSASMEDLLRFFFKIYESSKAEMISQSKKLGKDVSKQVYFCDFEGFPFSFLLCKPGVEMLLKVAYYFDTNYPEQLGASIIVNAPRAFVLVWSMMKPLLSERTSSKVFIFGNDRSEWLPFVLEYLDESVLPVYWGGKKVDDNNDPKCSSFIVYGGEVPKYYYIDNQLCRPSSDDDMIGVIVPKGEEHKVTFNVRDPGATLQYEFWTEDHDIGFGLKFSTSWGIKNIIKQERRNSHDAVQKGEVICKDVGEYILTFDNTFSRFRAKQLYYSVKIVAPDDEKKSKEPF